MCKEALSTALRLDYCVDDDDADDEEVAFWNEVDVLKEYGRRFVRAKPLWLQNRRRFELGVDRGSSSNSNFGSSIMMKRTLSDVSHMR